MYYMVIIYAANGYLRQRYNAFNTKMVKQAENEHFEKIRSKLLVCLRGSSERIGRRDGSEAR